MNKYQEDFDLVRKLCSLDGRELTILRYGIEEGKNNAIDEFAEKLKGLIEKDLANPDLMLECKKCGIWKARDIDEIAERLKGV